MPCPTAHRSLENSSWRPRLPLRRFKSPQLWYWGAYPEWKCLSCRCRSQDPRRRRTPALLGWYESTGPRTCRYGSAGKRLAKLGKPFQRSSIDNKAVHRAAMVSSWARYLLPHCSPKSKGRPARSLTFSCMLSTPTSPSPTVDSRSIGFCMPLSRRIVSVFRTILRLGSARSLVALFCRKALGR